MSSSSPASSSRLLRRCLLPLPLLLRRPPLPHLTRSMTLQISLMCLRTLRRIWGEKSGLKSLSLCKMCRRMLLCLRLHPRPLLSIPLLVLNLHH